MIGSIIASIGARHRLVRYLLIGSISIAFLIGSISIWASGEESTFAVTFGGSGTEEGSAVEQTKDGGYVIVGQTDSLGLGQDILVIRTDASGQIIWQRTYGTIDYDTALYVGETLSGQYYVVGGTGHGTWVLKLDQSGEVLWQKEYLIAGRAYSVLPTDEGGLVVAGAVFSKPQSLWIFELESDGDTAWQKSYVHKEAAFVGNPDIQRTRNGGFVLAAETMAGPFGAQNGTDLLVLKLSNVGEIVWQKAYGDAAINQQPVPMQQTSDGGYIIVSDYYEGFSFIKTDDQGNVVWQNKYQVEDRINAINSLYTLLETPDGGFVAFGTVRPGPVNMWLLKFDDQGKLEWQRRLGRSRDDSWAPSHDGWQQYSRSIKIQEDGDFIAVGTTDLMGTGDDFDIILLRLDNKGKIENCCIEESAIGLEVSPTYLVTIETDIVSSDVSFNVVDTNANVATPLFAPNYVCCGGGDLSVNQDGENVPSGGYYNFEDVQLGDSETVAFLFENKSNEEVGIGPIQINPADVFSTDMNHFTISPNGSKSFEIEFSPTTTGTVEGEIVFSNSDCDENPYHFSLMGTGFLSASPTPSPTATPTSSPSSTVTPTPTGTATATAPSVCLPVVVGGK